MTQNNLISIVTMWNKVNELSRENLSQQQIAIKLGIHRDTVRRYQMMSESEFNEHLHKEARLHLCKLDLYRDFIVDQLVAAPFLSSAQVLDHLKEHFQDLPSVSERTVYNVVRRIREEEDIAKEAEPGRSFSHVEDGDWGERAQVDYGEKWMRTAAGRQIKGVKFIPGETCLIFDEIQECPEARTSLKFFKEDDRFDVIATGSMLGVQGYGDELKKRHRKMVQKKDLGINSVPVGSEDIIEMYPLDFEEFLCPTE